MADKPPPLTDDDSARVRQRLTWRLASAGLLALGLLVVLLLACVLWIPKWLYPPLTGTDLQNVSDAAKVQELKGARLKLQNDARTTVLQGLGAVLILTGAAIGASVTLQQVRTTRDQIKRTATANRKQLELSREGQITDRFSRAVDQIGSEREKLDIILGGIYSLERIANESLTDQAAIYDIFMAYVRRHSRWLEDATQEEASRSANAPSLIHRLLMHDLLIKYLGRQVDFRADVIERDKARKSGLDRLDEWTGVDWIDWRIGFPDLENRAPDIQAILTVLGRRPRPPEGIEVRLNFRGLDLRRANLVNAHLEGSDFGDVHLEGASLNGAHLQGARFGTGHFQSIDFSGAYLDGAEFYGSRLEHSEFRDAHFGEVTFSGANLRGVTLTQVELDEAIFIGCDLSEAFVGSANFSRVAFRNVNLHGSQATDETKWPEGFDAEAAGVTTTKPEWISIDKYGDAHEVNLVSEPTAE